MDRPKIALQLDIIDWVMEITGAIALVLLFAIPLIYYSSLPETIPSHFDASGQVDDYSNKDFIWFLPGLGLVLYGGLFYLNRFPHIFNYPVKIAENNAERQYRLATRLMRVINVSIVMVFAYITNHIIQSALLGKSTFDIPVYLLTLIFLLPIAVYVILALRKTK